MWFGHSCSFIFVCFNNINADFEAYKLAMQHGTLQPASGQFSVHYLFPDVGLYEVVTRISAKDIAALAPFKVVVPMQPIPP
jgi:hypothetical protein